ncbi:G-protein-signaling modulator 1 isoform X5 [Canis lupus baileyi]|uniref:G-protein-signaling modulator 1 isoform X7 n=1 Tax=Canis lupus familiaris TaxID=9615 RepID=UPI0003ADBCEA|nr:G-protein-signaling modulator 1 isoform X7 [Canis lupus familiaris]XP_038404698.1 G-protein-signaling modulator 1 isoform X7 [Canis lupus familiaris]XP_038533931.1 G-protein-signaling modulator 1 isoform X7 [Canis lupus familiaris]XP_048970296.1 G-protein-signaling modulator 1 isoform X6 [Canis lupus dingo]|eukprot:XP_005625179.1 G-protein-signaling modulator 1 isoform X4 [Canis lupus familiaris]
MEAGVGAPGRLCNCWRQRGALSLGGPSGDPGPGARPKRTQRLSAETWGLLRLPLEREQNGDSHQVGEWRGPGRDMLPLPMRSRKYQEGLEATERPREGGHSPLDSADVRVQVPRTSIPRAPSSDEECFFDLLSKFQSSRMDDQRCPLEEGQPGAAEATAAPTPEERVAQPSLTASPQTEELLDLIASSQSRRLDDQRASVGSLPGLRVTHSNLGRLRGDGDPQEPGDEFFNMLIKCQSSRIDDQRCPPPDVLPRGPTMPDEDFFSLIQRVQAKRMDEQRVDLAGSPEQEADGSPEPRQQCQPGAS